MKGSPLGGNRLFELGTHQEGGRLADPAIWIDFDVPKTPQFEQASAANVDSLARPATRPDAAFRRASFPKSRRLVRACATLGTTIGFLRHRCKTE